VLSASAVNGARVSDEARARRTPIHLVAPRPPRRQRLPNHGLLRSQLYSGQTSVSAMVVEVGGLSEGNYRRARCGMPTCWNSTPTSTR
jgi:hypothetical protein